MESVPADVKAICARINNDLKELMYEQDVTNFHEKLHHFERTWSTSQPSFWGYMERYWISNEKYKRWAKSYQPAMYTNMETNNYVESWHRLLRHTYLRGKRSQGLDLLIHILVDRVWTWYAMENTCLQKPCRPNIAWRSFLSWPWTQSKRVFTARWCS